MSTYTIGEMAERSGFSASALRYYEGIGLVEPSTRTAAGDRLYDDHTLARLAFIARAKQLGCSLEEITDLVGIWDGERCGPIPIYDAAVPITCTIGRDEIPERIELVERMRQNLKRLERTEHGLLLHFPDRPEVQADLARFAVDEKRCCQFWGFAVDNTDGDLTLRWDAPPAANDLIAKIGAYFYGDEPLASISGLL